MKRLIIRLARWLASKAGADLIVFPRISDEILESAKMLCAQVEVQETSGEHKRAQVLRALMNRHPEAKARVLAAAIERVLCFT